MNVTPATPRRLLSTPAVAWPTLAVFAAGMAAWGATLAMAAAGRLSLPLAFLAATAAAFVLFTPLHDAAHRAVARRASVNAVVGRLTGLVLTGPFPAFRFVHLEHHKHTNDPRSDPDHWSGQGPAWARPLRWLTQDLQYYGFLARRWRGRPAAELVETAATLLLVLGVAATAFASGHGLVILACWLLPARAALALLAFCFDYLPHRPHRVTAREDPYQATHVHSDPVLTPLFLYQNYHLVHHLYPAIPFYRYARVWRAERATLLARGASERRLFGRSPAATQVPWSGNTVSHRERRGARLARRDEGAYPLDM